MRCRIIVCNIEFRYTNAFNECILKVRLNNNNIKNKHPLWQIVNKWFVFFSFCEDKESDQKSLTVLFSHRAFHYFAIFLHSLSRTFIDNLFISTDIPRYMPIFIIFLAIFLKQPLLRTVDRFLKQFYNNEESEIWYYRKMVSNQFNLSQSLIVKRSILSS